MKKYWILLSICIGGILTQSCQTQRTHASISERPMPTFFAGTTDTSKYKWEIKQEIIRSEHTGKIYPRLNPVITYSN